MLLIGACPMIGRHWGVIVARVELGHHVHEGHVEEDAGRGAEDPGRPVLNVTQQEAEDHADEREKGAKNSKLELETVYTALDEL